TRRSHTDYLTTNPINGSNYATNTSIHIRSLPNQQSVYDAANVEQARTTYEYDNYTQGLVNRSNVPGRDASFSIGYTTRGNVTQVTNWLLPSTALSTRHQYDMLGNVVSSTDPRNFTTTIDFTDRFGSPDNEAQSNTPPSELSGGLQTFAFATKVTNALN